jgi:hypothetical protein
MFLSIPLIELRHSLVEKNLTIHSIVNVKFNGNGETKWQSLCQMQKWFFNVTKRVIHMTILQQTTMNYKKLVSRA